QSLRLILPHEQVPHDLLRDREPALQLMRPRRVEPDLRDDVVPLRVPADRVRQPSPPPLPHVLHLAPARLHRTRQPLDRLRHILVGDIRAHHDDQLILPQDDLLRSRGTRPHGNRREGRTGAPATRPQTKRPRLPYRWRAGGPEHPQRASAPKSIGSPRTSSQRRGDGDGRAPNLFWNFSRAGPGGCAPAPANSWREVGQSGPLTLAHRRPRAPCPPSSAASPRSPPPRLPSPPSR